MKHGIGCHAMLARREGGRFRCRPVMQGLTLRPGVEWAPGMLPRYIHAVQQWAHRQFGRRLAYEVAMEMQKRGVPHYHVVWWLPKRLTLPKADKRGWWPHGSTNTTGTLVDGGAYLCKYVSKGSDAPLPAGARMYSTGGLAVAARLEYRWLRLPQWARGYFADSTEPLRRVSGGVASILTGEFARSPFDLVERGKNWAWLVFQQVRPLPVRCVNE